MVAGPYGTGAKTEEDRHRNLMTLNRAAYEIFQKGHIPIIGVNLALPIIESAGEHTYGNVMLPLSLAVSERCDAILRIGGECHGADLEVERVLANGGKLYASVSEIPSAHEEDSS